MDCALLTRLRDAGLSVSRNGDHLVVTPRERLTDELRARIRMQKAELLASILAVPTPDAAPLRRTSAGPLADFAAAIRSGTLQECHACQHFTKLIPADGDNLGVPDAGWCRRYSTVTHPLTPFWCDGYSPSARSTRGAK